MKYNDEDLQKSPVFYGILDPGYLVVEGVTATLNSYDANIHAYIKVTQQNQSYLCLSVKSPNKRYDGDQQSLNKLIDLFSLLCKKNNIEKIKENWVSKRTDSESNTDYYEFNIKADDFHELMLKESEFYIGYRKSIYSVYQLAHPETKYYKPDCMCLFPIHPLESEIIIRNAGCNVSEVLSVQLSTLIKELLDDYQTKPIAGHHQPIILEDLGVYFNQLISAALKCAGASEDYIKQNNYHEAFEGANVIPLTESTRTFIQDIDSSNLSIYGVSANTTSYLSTLKSFEVPIKEYLLALKDVCHDNQKFVQIIEELVEKIEASHVSKLRY